MGGTTSFDLKSDGGVFKVRDVSGGNELYHIAAGGSGYHKWYINDSLKMTLNSSGNVGIGTGSTAPQHKLNVQVGTDSRLGVFGNGTYVGIGAVVDNNSAYRAMKLYATDYEFRVGNTPKLTISSGGAVQITNLVKFADTTAGSAGTPQFKNIT